MGKSTINHGEKHNKPWGRNTINHGEEHNKPWREAQQTMGRNSINHEGNIP